MEKSMFLTDGYVNGDHHQQHQHQQQHLHPNQSFTSSSIRDVSYSCGSCGYELNLSSSNRNTSTIGSKYGKSLRRGVISFFNIDESRFTQVDEYQCIPYFISKQSWGLLRPKTKLLCRKCGKNVGNAYADYTSSAYSHSSDGSDSASANEISTRKKYNIRIRALQPSSTEESGVSLVT